MKVIIEKHDVKENYFKVTNENGEYCDMLCWDEMLGQVAAMTISEKAANPKGLYNMMTDEQWAELKKQRGY